MRIDITPEGEAYREKKTSHWETNELGYEDLILTELGRRGPVPVEHFTEDPTWNKPFNTGYQPDLRRTLRRLFEAKYIEEVETENETL